MTISKSPYSSSHADDLTDAAKRKTLVSKGWAKTFPMRFLLFFAGALLGGALILSAWQGYRYERLLHSVSNMEDEQVYWHERNKLEIVKIAMLRSSNRIDGLAGELGLRPIDPRRLLTVQMYDSQSVPDDDEDR